jgi:hypothetical protein
MIYTLLVFNDIQFIVIQRYTVYWYSIMLVFNDATHLWRSGLNTFVNNSHRHWLRRG